MEHIFSVCLRNANCCRSVAERSGLHLVYLACNLFFIYSKCTQFTLYLLVTYMLFSCLQSLLLTWREAILPWLCLLNVLTNAYQHFQGRRGKLLLTYHPDYLYSFSKEQIEGIVAKLRNRSICLVMLGPHILMHMLEKTLFKCRARDHAWSLADLESHSSLPCTSCVTLDVL